MSLDASGRGAERVARPLLAGLWLQVERAGEVARRVLANENLQTGPKQQAPVDEAAVKAVRSGKVPSASPDMCALPPPANAD